MREAASPRSSVSPPRTVGGTLAPPIELPTGAENGPNVDLQKEGVRQRKFRKSASRSEDGGDSSLETMDVDGES